MATQAIEQTAEGTDAAAPPPAKSNKTTLILAVVGILAGSSAGLFALGPMLAKRGGTHAPAAKAAEQANSFVVHAVENLVLNPAGSGGTRFLMVNATFELKDGAAEQLMKDHEAEVRDHILGLLGKKTVDELTDMTRREGLKKEVIDAVAPLFPKGAVKKVFFPQFVIQ
jgi:flagellar FliL protein